MFNFNAQREDPKQDRKMNLIGREGRLRQRESSEYGQFKRTRTLFNMTDRTLLIRLKLNREKTFRTPARWGVQLDFLYCLFNKYYF